MSAAPTARPGPGPLPRHARVLVAGAGGLVGSAIVRRLHDEGFTAVATPRSSELDLTDRAATARAVAGLAPDVVVDAAARVGGIAANAAEPVEFLHDNLRIQANLFEAAHAAGVDRLLFLGSSCIYPRLAPQPIREDSLLTGPLEETNDAYAVAKIAGITAVQAYRREYGRRWISAMPTNLYGPGDNFHPERSHVLPALIRRFHEAVEAGDRQVTVWGSGTPRREFLHTDDLSAAVLHLLEHYDDPSPVNIGVGADVTIAELAALVAETVGFTGEIVWDTSRPDGTPRKLLDVSRLTDAGWTAGTGLREGLASTYAWFRAQEVVRV